VTPILDNDVYLYNISQLTMYPQDMAGGTITLYAKDLASGILLVTFILELRILVDGIHTQTEYFYLTVRST
jgi:hypothetical protein